MTADEALAELRRRFSEIRMIQSGGGREFGTRCLQLLLVIERDWCPNKLPWIKEWYGDGR